MSLQLSGKVLGVRREPVTPPAGASWEAFQRVTIVVGTEDYRKEYVTVGRNFDQSTLPAEGEDVRLSVWATSYVSKSGQPRVEFTAQARIPEHAGLRKAV